ncbi:hypothetical protein RRG08_042431 [Elysia crispata]|uniref:Uncharacterized protein n=1 Tax=Elysia crispata TaxID=231223 RepID=A0AAE0ZC98_9GAST|nr:hypothetical protein RRG08_042431 [Elysia crispata]
MRGSGQQVTQCDDSDAEADAAQHSPEVFRSVATAASIRSNLSFFSKAPYFVAANSCSRTGFAFRKFSRASRLSARQPAAKSTREVDEAGILWGVVFSDSVAQDPVADSPAVDQLMCL